MLLCYDPLQDEYTAAANLRGHIRQKKNHKGVFL